MAGNLIPTRARYPIMALGIFALLAAMWAGLLRMGWQFPPLVPTLAGVHGPLMVAGFLGTLISMERAVALGRRWTYAAPLFSALGALVLISGLAPIAGALLVTLGSVGMVAIFVVIVRRQTVLFTITMALGAACWLIGNGMWLFGAPISRVVLWWAAFLVLTIVGERLELSRLLRLSRRTEILFLASIGIFLLGLVADFIEGAVLTSGTDAGTRIAGAGMIAMALWLLRYDIARRTVRQTGLTRFIALALLAGYGWLLFGGLLRVMLGGMTAGAQYDAMLHTVFLGFVMSMIFGHAPIILPAVLGRAMRYSPLFFAHLALLHLSLILRVAGDLSGVLALRQWGGMFNVIAVLLFLFATARAMRAGTHTTP
ncbi:MAG: hypothetical protein KGJ80_01295 [Chloroflexota bacterium]|nr:hypothetical protein [Chloroflexota bacterium]